MLKFLRGRIELNSKDYLGPHVGNRQRPKFPMDLKRESARATQSGRVAAWGRRKVKLWEEPDQKLVTDDVRGGCCSFWAERHHAAARTPARFKSQKLDFRTR